MKILLGNKNTRWIFWFVGVLIISALACSDSGEDPGKSFDTAANPLPTPTLSSITVREIEENHDQLTDIQWDDYTNSLAGARVRWTVRVTEVEDDGTFFLNAGEMHLLTSVYLDGVSTETARTINKDQLIEVEASIEKVNTFLGTVSVWLHNPTDLVLK